jgi:hypothetical protein
MFDNHKETQQWTILISKKKILEKLMSWIQIEHNRAVSLGIPLPCWISRGSSIARHLSHLLIFLTSPHGFRLPLGGNDSLPSVAA